MDTKSQNKGHCYKISGRRINAGNDILPISRRKKKEERRKKKEERRKKR
jgi:hypothetical protein